MEPQKSHVKGRRFNAGPIWTAHLKGLKNRDFTQRRPVGVPDVAGRLALWGLPLSLWTVGYTFGATIAAVDGLLAASGILAGGLFMAFSQIAAWRDRYTQRKSDHEASELPKRYMLDEAVAHTLVATYACLFLAVSVVVGANFADRSGRLDGISAAITIVLGVYVLLLMFMIMPKLYAAYAVTHQVDDEMSGLSR